MKKFLFTPILILLCAANVFSQENSPYTRYALGDVVPNSNIISRSMGGISAAYYDNMFLDGRANASINATNPGTYGFSRITGKKKGQGGLVTLDIGIDANSRTIKEANTNKKFTSSYGILNYINIGLPLKKGWGVNLGFAPETRINYKLFYNERLYDPVTNTEIDTAKTTYSGTGGVYKVFVGSGWAIKNFGFGFNVGYLFGSREVDSRRDFLNDSVIYYSADYNTNTSFGNVFFNLGLHQSFELKKEKSKKDNFERITWLRLGAYAQLQPALQASQDIKRETNYISPAGNVLADTISFQSGLPGTIKYPATFGFGAIIEKELKWLVGIDVVTSSWANYRFYGAKDYTANTLQIKIGGQYYPDAASKKLFRRMAYRGGFNYTTEPYSFNGHQIKQISGSLGLGIPFRNKAAMYQNSLSTVLNLSLEFGTRGKSSDILKENFIRFGIGFSLSDWWFTKAKYY